MTHEKFIFNFPGASRLQKLSWKISAPFIKVLFTSQTAICSQPALFVGDSVSIRVRFTVLYRLRSTDLPHSWCCCVCSVSLTYLSTHLPSSFSTSSSSSSIGTTAHCGLWPVKQCPSIFPYLPQISPSSHSQHSKISFYFLFPSFPASWVKIFLGILSSSILSRWPNQLILCLFIHFTIFSPLLISPSSRFFRFFHSPFSSTYYLSICFSTYPTICSSVQP